MNLKNIAIVSGKFGIAGAVICAIGWGVLTQDVSIDATPGEVQTAEADIIDARIADGSEFTRAMQSLGFRPRAFDMNGNTMYFASGYADGQSPYEVMDLVQEEMINYGVNSRNWLGEEPTANTLAKSSDFQQIFDPTKSYDPSKLKKLDNDGMSNAMLSGELVPLRKDKDYIIMGGVNPGRDIGDVVNQFQDDGARSPIRDYLGGYRYVDATNEPGEDRTMVTAVWTDDDFDAKKMDNRAFKQQPADPNVPACVGCKREFRIQSLQKDEPFRQNKWSARNANMQTTYDFYKKAMARRGWSESGVQAKINRLAEVLPEAGAVPGRTLNLEKDGKTMTITLLPGPNGGTEVYSSEQYEDVQSIVD